MSYYPSAYPTSYAGPMPYMPSAYGYPAYDPGYPSPYDPYYGGSYHSGHHVSGCRSRLTWAILTYRT